MVFSRDGALLAVGGYYTCIVQVFEADTGKEIVRFKPHEESPTLAFSADGSTLLTGSADSTILIWDFRSPALQKTKK
jgi:WD40 repeat protein